MASLSVSSAARWLRALPTGAYIVAVAAVLAVVTVAVGTGQPPNPLAASILQSVTFVFGVWGSYAFARSTTPKVDSSLVKAASRNLGVIAVKAAEARRLAEGAYEGETRAAAKSTVGMISVHMSYIEDIALNEISNWHAVGDGSVGDQTGSGEPNV